MTNDNKKMFDEIAKIFEDTGNEEIVTVRIANFINTIEGKTNKLSAEFFAAKLISMRVLTIFSENVSTQLFELNNEKEDSLSLQLNMADLVTALTKAGSIIGNSIIKALANDEKKTKEDGTDKKESPDEEKS